MATVMIDGVEYFVTERLGWQPSAGVYALVVSELGACPAMVAVSDRANGPWRFRTIAERLGFPEKVKGGG